MTAEREAHPITGVQGAEPLDGGLGGVPPISPFLIGGGFGREEHRNIEETIRRLATKPTNAPFEIRPATAADEAAVLALLEELFEPPGSPPPDYTTERGRTGFRTAVNQPDADVLLATDGDSIVGLASVYADIQSIRYGKRCWLQDLVVTSEYRSRKVGHQLLAAATEWARERGCTHLELASGAGRLDAHRFYKREGMSQSYNFQLWIGG